MLLGDKDRGLLSYDGLTAELDRLITSNPTLPVTQRIHTYHIDDCTESLVLFLAMMHLFVQNGDDHIMKHDLEDYFDGDHCGRAMLRHEVRFLELGEHPLQDIVSVLGLLGLFCFGSALVSFRRCFCVALVLGRFLFVVGSMLSRY